MKKTYSYLLSILLYSLLCISSAQANLFETIRNQNDEDIFAQHINHGHAQANQFEGTKRPYCVASSDVNVRIYMYHYIRPEHWDPTGGVVWNNSITPGNFERHMSYLSNLANNNSVHVGFLSELETRHTSNCFPHNDIVILTADDGRRDNYKYLYPTTKRHGIKFNLGIIFNKVAMTYEEREDPFTTKGEIQEMLDSGIIEIQSHSLSHADLRSLHFQQQAEEICYSKQYLEDLFGISINTFIAPYGGMTSHVEYISDYCEYSYVLTTNEGHVNDYELTHTPYKLQRLRVGKGFSPEILFGK